MKKTTKVKLVLQRDIVKTMHELRDQHLDKVRGGLRFNTGCSEYDSGCGIATAFSANC